MITSPESNVKLSDKDTAAIEEGQRRLANIELQITVQTRNLRTIKVDSENLTKDIILGQEKLSALQSLITSTQSEVDGITKNKETVSKELEDSRIELNSLIVARDYKKVEISDLTTEYATKTTEWNNRETSVSLREEDVKKSQEELEAKHAKIKDFANNL